MKRISPALALFILSPAIGELLSGSSPPLEFFNPLTFVLLAMLYGCGALLCRELVVRWRKGWFSLLLLGMAYGIYEEGIIVRSFFDPAWEDLENLAVYGRVNGVNWVWVEHLTHYHALVSIAASVALVEIIYPQRRGERWLGKRAWIACWIGLLAWLPLSAAAFVYDAPDSAIGTTWLVILGLILAARLLPKRLLPPRERSVPRPRRFWLVGFLGVFAYFFTVYWTADRGTPEFGITMLLLLALDALILALVLRWSGNGAAWDDRHRLALIAGGLSLFILTGIVLEIAGALGMSLVALVTAIGFWRLARRVRKRFALAEADTLPPLPVA